MKKLFRDVKALFDDIARNNINAHSAASAFYTFISIVPFIALFASVLPYTSVSQEQLLSAIKSYIPIAMEDLISTVISDIYYASDAVLPISAALSVWSASRAFQSLIRGIEDICDVPRYSTYFSRVIRACIYTVGLIALMIIVPTLMLYWHSLLSYIFSGEENIPLFFNDLRWLRYPLVCILLTVVFIMIYRWVPGMKLGYGSLIPGAASASVIWLLFSYFFALLLRLTGGYSTYGSLAVIIVCMMWMYWCMYIILFGAELNVFISRRKAQRLADAEN